MVIKTLKDIEVEGWYWIADTSDCDAQWICVQVTGDLADLEEGSEATWEYSTMPDDYTEEILEDHVLLGPIDPPDVAIPIATPRVPLQFTKVPLLTVIPTIPSLTPIKR